MLLLVRLLWSLTAQRRLSIITRTLTGTAGALAHLLLLTAAVLVLLVAAGVLALGHLSPTLGDLPTALRGALPAGWLVGCWLCGWGSHRRRTHAPGSPLTRLKASRSSPRLPPPTPQSHTLNPTCIS